jgi:hypothetical protein
MRFCHVFYLIVLCQFWRTCIWAPAIECHILTGADTTTRPYFCVWTGWNKIFHYTCGSRPRAALFMQIYLIQSLYNALRCLFCLHLSVLTLASGQCWGDPSETQLKHKKTSWRLSQLWREIETCRTVPTYVCVCRVFLCPHTGSTQGLLKISRGSEMRT